MPDHPHEGECKPETTFTVNGIAISTQIIATSFVTGGNTSGGKNPTDPHCFPSISVWDGRAAGAGRIVVDSTWHHFVNVNLNGVGTSEVGLSTADFEVVRQYYMNIATWMTRRRLLPCWYNLIVFELYANSQIIEASLNNPDKSIEEIPLADLNSIGALAEEILASKYNPVFARNFLLEIIEGYNSEFESMLNVWRPKAKTKGKKIDQYYTNWLNLDLILWTAIGSGFIALRDAKRFSLEIVKEKDLDKVFDIFSKGIDYGFQSSIQNLNQNMKSLMKMRKNKN